MKNGMFLEEIKEKEINYIYIGSGQINQTEITFGVTLLKYPHLTDIFFCRLIL